MEDVFGIAIRITFSYIYVLALLRLTGKRSIGSLSPLDFLVALILGDLFDDIFWAEIPLAQGLVAITTVLLLHTLVSVAEAHSFLIHRLISSKPALVIDHGKLQEKNLEKERTSEEELFADLRMAGEDDLIEIREAYFEPGGKVSVLPTDAADEIRKLDLDKFKKRVKQ